MIDDPAIFSLRDRIDAIDHQLLRLLEERLHVVHEVGEQKRLKNLPVFDPKREEALLQRIIRDAPEVFDEEAVREIFSAIVGQCRRLEATALSDFGQGDND